jgi:lipopolysaccharide transport system ATP-binding protein
VAAHLEPEILIVDEVLAVGDAEFQKKALGKMKDISQGQGRTVLFVSHNMGAIKSLCNKGILLNNGRMEFMDDDIENVVSRYYNSVDRNEETILIKNRTDRVGDGRIFLEEFILLNSNKNIQLELGKQIGFIIKYHSALDFLSYKFLISINNQNGDCVIFLDSSIITGFPSSISKKGSIEIRLSKDFALPAGAYFVNIAVFAEDRMADYVVSALKFEVVDGLFYDMGKVPSGKGACFIKQEWLHEEISE